MEILDHRWMGSGQIGIVKVQTDYDGIKYYMGLTKSGNTPLQDMEHIADYGSTVIPDDMIKFLEE